MIYLIQESGSNAIKIGFTNRLLSHRLRELQIASPHDLTLVSLIPGDREFEKSLHDEFQQFHIRGEWFHSNILEPFQMKYQLDTFSPIALKAYQCNSIDKAAVILVDDLIKQINESLDEAIKRSMIWWTKYFNLMKKPAKRISLIDKPRQSRNLRRLKKKYIFKQTDKYNRIIMDRRGLRNFPWNPIIMKNIEKEFPKSIRKEDDPSHEPD